MHIDPVTLIRSVGARAAFLTREGEPKNGYAAFVADGAEDVAPGDKSVAAGSALVSWMDEGKRMGTVIPLNAASVTVTLRDEANDEDVSFRVGGADLGEVIAQQNRVYGLIDSSMRARRAAAEAADAAAQPVAEQDPADEPEEVRIARIAAAVVKAANAPAERERAGRKPLSLSDSDLKIAIMAAYAGDDALVAAIKDPGLMATVDLAEMSMVYMHIARVNENAFGSISPEEMLMAERAREIRQRIHEIDPDNVDAMPGTEEPRDSRPDDHDALEAADRVREVISGLNVVPEMTERRMRSNAGLSGDMTLFLKVMSRVTTAGLGSGLEALPVSAATVRSLGYALGTEGISDEWTGAVDRAVRITLEPIIRSGYDFKAKFFEKDDVTLMIVSDQADAVVYAFPSETRVLNPVETIRAPITREEVVDAEGLDLLREKLNEMTRDNAAEIDFV
ncbi:MAG: hypothetical protein DI629_17665 [Mesorhizobium amorphae]|nr:MAG: hypothetical protein DI629_17665 [Mesorhizobium amorphae]